MIEFKGKKIERSQVTLVLQQPHFYGDLTVGENIEIVRIFNKGVERKKISALCDHAKISHIYKRQANVCSGGEKARANIIRGIAENKKVLLIDEPTAHLDFENSTLMAEVIRNIAQERVVIVTTHQKELFNFKNSVFIYIIDGELYEDN